MAILRNFVLAGSDHTETIIYGAGKVLASGDMNEEKDGCAAVVSYLP